MVKGVEVCFGSPLWGERVGMEFYRRKKIRGSVEAVPLLIIFADMKIIGLIADTHCVFPDIVKVFLGDVDEIWHLGDVFSQSCFDEINSFKEVTHVVKGNWDESPDIPEFDSFYCEGKKILMVHKGMLWKDDKREFYNGVFERIVEEKPNLLLYGHTHRFDYCAMSDLQDIINRRVICINPGAVSPLFFERGSCLKMVFKDGELREVKRLSYDCPTVRLKFQNSNEEGRQCLMPSIYERERSMSMPYFEQLGILEERPANIKVEQVHYELWQDGSEWVLTGKDRRNPWKSEIVFGVKKR